MAGWRPLYSSIVLFFCQLPLSLLPNMYTFYKRSLLFLLRAQEQATARNQGGTAMPVLGLPLTVLSTADGFISGFVEVPGSQNANNVTIDTFSDIDPCAGHVRRVTHDEIADSVG